MKLEFWRTGILNMSENKASKKKTTKKVHAIGQVTVTTKRPSDQEPSQTQTFRDGSPPVNPPTVMLDSGDKEIPIVVFDVEGKMIHIKVGTHDRPATDEDVSAIEEKIVDLFNNNNINCLAFVTHHAVEVDVIK